MIDDCLPDEMEDFHLPLGLSPDILDELRADGIIVNCVSCGDDLSEGGHYYEDDHGDGVYYCEPCVEERVELLKDEAVAYAELHCKVTRKIPDYIPDLEFRCTPEEYEGGCKESYTPSAYAAYCRHECTNYDTLVWPLNRDSLAGQICYWAIRRRIEQLLDEAEAGEEDGT